jgi:hypothetical protein
MRRRVASAVATIRAPRCSQSYLRLGVGNDDYHAVRVILAHRLVIGVQHSPGFLGDRGKHFLRRRTAGHQRCHPPQRGLLARNPVVADSPTKAAMSRSVSAPTFCLVSS